MQCACAVPTRPRVLYGGGDGSGGDGDGGDGGGGDGGDDDVGDGVDGDGGDDRGVDGDGCDCGGGNGGHGDDYDAWAAIKWLTIAYFMEYSYSCYVIRISLGTEPFQ